MNHLHVAIVERNEETNAVITEKSSPEAYQEEINDAYGGETPESHGERVTDFITLEGGSGVDALRKLLLHNIEDTHSFGQIAEYLLKKVYKAGQNAGLDIGTDEAADQYFQQIIDHHQAKADEIQQRRENQSGPLFAGEAKGQAEQLFAQGFRFRLNLVWSEDKSKVRARLQAKDPQGNQAQARDEFSADGPFDLGRVRTGAVEELFYSELHLCISEDKDQPRWFRLLAEYGDPVLFQLHLLTVAE